MNTREQIVTLRQLMRVEKEADFQQYQQKILNSSVSDRKREGVCWYPVRFQSHRITTGDRITIQLEKPDDDTTDHVFQVGSVVSIFQNLASVERAHYTGGVVSYLRKNVMKIVLNSQDLPQWIKEGKIGVDLMFDEATYREMDRALVRLIEAETGRISELRELFYGKEKARVEAGHSYQSISLNDRQNDALTLAMNALDLAIIHGPPGTGKTTTLVQAIGEVVKTEKQVLVCAPSNAAVDLLVEKLADNNLKVLRLGHPARVSGAAVERSLDHLVSTHSSYKQLKGVRKRSEELKKLGQKYKRNYGHAERKQRRLILDEARNLKLEADHIEHYITSELLDSTEVVACTLINANHNLIRSRNFKSVFIDEASQALEPASWIPIMKAERAILAGDHHQLPPTIKSYEAGKQGLEITLFEKAVKNQEVDVMLEKQYRMHPDIMNFPGKIFYKDKLRAAESVLKTPPLDNEPFEFIDTAGCSFDEKVDKLTLSTFNPGEGVLLVRHLKGFIENNFKAISTRNLKIGVIAPYKAHINLLDTLISEDEFFENLSPNLTINTVDAFQGQERDIIYIGLVRSNDKGEIGFLKEIRRLNVAMTRAKLKLVMIGDSATLGQHEFFVKLIEYVGANGVHKSAFEFEAG